MISLQVHFAFGLRRVESRLDSLEQDFRLDRGDFAWAQADASRVLILARNITYEQVLGCGVLVVISGDYYIATNWHVINESWFVPDLPDLVGVLAGGLMLDLSAVPLLYEEEPDLALIPLIWPQQGLDTQHALEISTESLALGTELRAISSAHDNRTATRCTLRTEGAKGLVLADCHGAYGFSGTGYVDKFGRLVALHVGFEHLGFSARGRSHVDSSVRPIFRHGILNKSFEAGSVDVDSKIIRHASVTNRVAWDMWLDAWEKCQPGRLPPGAPPLPSGWTIQPDCFEQLDSVVAAMIISPAVVLVQARLLVTLHDAHQREPNRYNFTLPLPGSFGI